MSSGAVCVWGRVGIVSPPRLILPLNVEPSKPRLCVDARFLNLWMKDVLFSLDKITDVPRYVYHGSYMTKCDDKSGYDHVLLTSDSQAYFGFEWGGLWFVCRTLPFGWKISPFIYHSIGLAVSSFLRDQGIPFSLHIDDRLNGELLTQSGPWSVLYSNRLEEFMFQGGPGFHFCCPVWFGRARLHNWDKQVCAAPNHFFGVSGFCRRLSKAVISGTAAKDYFLGFTARRDLGSP